MAASRDARGWRLDVADRISDSFISEDSCGCARKRSDAVIIGEVWGDASLMMRTENSDSILRA